MKDIVPELLDKIQKDFKDSFIKSDKLKALQVLIDNKEATYKQANEYAIEVGNLLSDVFKKHISSSTLPDGKMYFNIAERILNPTLENNYNLVTKITKEIQEELNRQAGLGINVSVPKVRQNKIKGIVDRVSSEEHFDDVAWILEEPVINFTHNAVNDLLEENANFQAKAGLKPKIVRTLVGGACDWCVALAGTYTYPDVPSDIYRRHERCRCTVEYIAEGVKPKSVWS